MLCWSIRVKVELWRWVEHTTLTVVCFFFGNFSYCAWRVGIRGLRDAMSHLLHQRPSFVWKKIEVEWVYVRAEDAFGDHHHHHHQQQQQQLASCGRHNEQSSDTGDSGGFYVRVLSHSRPAANRSSGLYTLTSLSRSLQCTETLLFSFFHVFAHVAPVTSSLLFFFLRTE